MCDPTVLGSTDDDPNDEVLDEGYAGEHGAFVRVGVVEGSEGEESREGGEEGGDGFEVDAVEEERWDGDADDEED